MSPTYPDPSLRPLGLDEAREWPLPLTLDEAQRASIRDAALAAYPHEACGLLVGRDGEVEEVTIGRNLDDTRAHDRYTLDPTHLLHVEDDAEQRGLSVLGVWHSHPDHPAIPSETDRAGAWANWSYVIVSVRAGLPDGLRSWRLLGKRFVEQEVVA